MSELGIVILNYNTRDRLRDCLASLRQAEDLRGIDVFVVDNASNDGSVQMVRSEFPEVEIVASQTNLGFSGGNNLGIERMRAGGGLPPFVLLLNPDTVVPPRALREMIDLFERYPDVGAAGPRLVMPSGQIDWACRRGFPTPLVSLYHFVGLSRLFPRSRRFGRYRMTFLDERAVADVDSVVGAFMLVRREAIEQVGALDEAFFMYGEDVDWALRIKRAGWRVVYNGRVDVFHHKRESSRKSPRALVEFYRAMAIFFDKHYAPLTPKPLRALIKLAIAAMVLRARVAAEVAR